MFPRTHDILVEPPEPTPLELAWQWVEDISSLQYQDIPRHLQDNAQHIDTLPNGSGALITLPGDIRIGNQNLIPGLQDPDSNGQVIVQYLEEDIWRTLWTPQSYQGSLNVYEYMASFNSQAPSAETTEAPRQRRPQPTRSRTLAA